MVECPASRQYLDAERKQGKIIPNDDTVAGGQIALSERQLEVLQIINDNPTVTRKMLAEKLGINESAVQKHLEALKQNGIIKHVGKTRGHWEILPRL